MKLFKTDPAYSLFMAIYLCFVIAQIFTYTQYNRLKNCKNSFLSMSPVVWDKLYKTNQQLCQSGA